MNGNSRLSSTLRRAPTRYVPIELIARGGMAEVWKASAVLDTGHTLPVAIKRVLPQLAKDPTFKSMFADEARLGMRFKHPNIVHVYDAREVHGTFIMIMELVDGTSLKAVLDRAHQRSAFMPVATALHVAHRLASALSFAHIMVDQDGKGLGIIHRDVSPHNLLLGKDGSVKLADFGLADANVHQTRLDGGLMGGKLGYLAPEVIGGGEVTPRFDIFGAGIVLWEMLCGRKLFSRETDEETVRAVAACEVPTPSSVNPRVPPAVDALLARALAKDPARRTPTAEILVEHLERVIEEIDAHGTARDVSLVVGMHLAMEPNVPETRIDAASVFEAELTAFVEATGAHEAGAAPLDPALFSEPAGPPTAEALSTSPGLADALEQSGEDDAFEG